MEETEYTQYIADQKKLLDELYLEYETVLNERLDNTEALLEEMIGTVNANADSINATLIEVADGVGHTMTIDMQSIWNSSIEALDGIISTYGDDFGAKMTAVNNLLAQIEANTAAMIINGDEQGEETVDSSAPTTDPDPSVTAPSSPNTPESSSPSDTPTESANTQKSYPYGKASDTTGTISTGSGTHIKAIQYALNELGYGNAGTESLDGVYGGQTKQAVMSFQRATNIPADGIVGDQTREQFRLKEYKTGGLVDYTGLAQLDGTPGKPELVLNARDTENFIALRNYLHQLANQDVTLFPRNNNVGNISPIKHTGFIDTTQAIRQLTNQNPTNNVQQSVGDINIDVHIDHVDDYNDFVNQLRDDPKFEKMIQSMTLGRINGKSALEKYQYRWK